MRPTPATAVSDNAAADPAPAATEEAPGAELFLGPASDGAGGAKCPDGSNPVFCLLRPCSVVACGQGQVCRDSYCGGCVAK